MKPYTWQSKLLKIYKGKGIIKGAPGSGKTYGAILLIKDRNYTDILIAVPTLPLKKQWETELSNHNISATVETFHKLCKPKYASFHDLLIVDECHRSTSSKFIKLYKHQTRKHILGLSATPNKHVERFCGPIIITISLKDANIANFKVIFTPINLQPIERAQYQQLSYKLSNVIQRAEDTIQNKKIIDSLIFKRRSLVYRAKERVPKTVRLLNELKGNNILVICQRIDQADKIAELTNIPVYHSKDKNDQNLQDFRDGKIKALVSVGMLKEGFDKRDIDVLIITSTALTEAYHIQTLGRAIRLPNDAVIYILLARDTTDEKVLKYKNLYNHEIQGNFTGKYESALPEIGKLYYSSNSFSLDSKHKIFKRTEHGRQYYKDNPIIDELRRVIPQGGRFRVSKEGKVIIKKKTEYKIIGTLTKPLEPLIEIVDSPDKTNWEKWNKIFTDIIEKQ